MSKHAPWTKEEAREQSERTFPDQIIPSGVAYDKDFVRPRTLEKQAFLAGIAWAAAQIEKCPTITGTAIRGLWEEDSDNPYDTHEAKLVGVREVEK